MLLLKKMTAAELGGAAFTALCSIFMLHLYDLSGRELIGILFGAVNSSAWEHCKTLLLPYFIWSVLELLSLRPPAHCFTVIKAASLYALGGIYLLLKLPGVTDFVSAAAAIAAAVAVTIVLSASSVDLSKLFTAAVVMLFAFFALYFSLTPFPPRHPLFFDNESGMYGIIPKHFDYGAAALDTMYGM